MAGIELTGHEDRKTRYFKSFVNKCIIIGLAGPIIGVIIGYALGGGDVNTMTPLSIIQAFSDPLFDLSKMGAGIGIGFVIALFAILYSYMNYEKYKNMRPNEEHGSAKLMTSGDMPKFNQQFFYDPKICEKFETEAAKKKGYTYYDKENLKKVCKSLSHKKEVYDACFLNSQIMGQNVYLSMNAKFINRNLNTITVGGSGQGKSFSELFPNTLSANCNYVFTDPSGEILQKTGKFLMSQGYKIKVFNVDEFNLSMKYNPLAYVETEKDYNILVDALNRNIKPNKTGGGSNEFFDDAKDSLMCALFALLKELYPSDYKAVGKPAVESFTKDYQKAVEKYNKATGADKDITKYPELQLRSEVESALKNEINTLLGNTKGKKDKNNDVQRYLKLRKNNISKPEKDRDPEFLQLCNYRAVKRYIDLESLFNDKQNYEHNIMRCCVAKQNSRKQTISNAMELLRMAQQEQDADGNATSTLDTLFGSIRSVNPRSFAAKMYENFKAGGPKVCNEVIISAAAVFGRFFDTDDIAWLTLEDELHLEELATEQKCALFLVIPQDTKTYNFMASMIYSQLFSIATKGGKQWRDEHGLDNPALPRHLSFWLDEFANIGKIPSFMELLSVVRKYNISINIIIQGMAQLKGMYPHDEWEVILANLDTMIYLGGMEPSTVKWLSEKLGKETINSMNTSYAKQGSQSKNSMARSLLTTDEIEQMSRSNELIFISGCKPIQTRKYDLTKHPNYKYSGEADEKNNLNITAYINQMTNSKIDVKLLDFSTVTESAIKTYNFDNLYIKDGYERHKIDNPDADVIEVDSEVIINSILNDNNLSDEEKQRRINEFKGLDDNTAIDEQKAVERFVLTNAEVIDGFSSTYEYNDTVDMVTYGGGNKLSHIFDNLPNELTSNAELNNGLTDDVMAVAT